MPSKKKKEKKEAFSSAPPATTGVTTSNIAVFPHKLGNPLRRPKPKTSDDEFKKKKSKKGKFDINDEIWDEKDENVNEEITNPLYNFRWEAPQNKPKKKRKKKKDTVWDYHMLYDYGDGGSDSSIDGAVGESKDMPIIKASNDRADSRIGGKWTWEEAEPYDHPLNKPAGGGWGNPPTASGGGNKKRSDPNKRVKNRNKEATKNLYKENLKKLSQ